MNNNLSVDYVPLGGYQGRRIDVYLHSEKEKQRIDKVVKERGISLSKYIISLIDADLSKDIRPPTRSKDMDGLKEQIAILQEDVRLKDQQIRQYKSLLERQKALAILDEDLEAGEISSRLTSVLKANGPVHEARLLEILGVEPSDLDMTLAISKQLEFLEGHGWIKKGARGYRWTK